MNLNFALIVATPVDKSASVFRKEMEFHMSTTALCCKNLDLVTHRFPLLLLKDVYLLFT